MWEKLSAILFGAAFDENSIQAEAKAIRILFETLKKEGFSEQQALELVSAIVKWSQPKRVLKSNKFQKQKRQNRFCLFG